jgi:predicted negative regulator of RcsB-dependent stress response
MFEHLGDVYKALKMESEAKAAWGKALKYEAKEKGLKERVEKKLNR